MGEMRNANSTLVGKVEEATRKTYAHMGG